MPKETIRVRDLMTADPATLAEDDSLALASDVMRLGRVRHLPVLDANSKIVGVLSDRDLAGGALLRASGLDEATERRLLERMTVAEVMTREVVTTPPGNSIQAAARKMNRRKISCLPVVEKETLVGIVTERDFVVALAEAEKGHRESMPRELEPDPEPKSEPTWDWRNLEEHFDRLRTTRDELRVQLRLASMDAKDSFEDAERRWAELEHRIRALGHAGGEAVEDAVRVSRGYVKEIRGVYERLREKVET